MTWADFIREVSPFLFPLCKTIDRLIPLFPNIRRTNCILSNYQIGIIERLIGICCILNLSDICKKQKGNDCMHQIPY